MFDFTVRVEIDALLEDTWEFLRHLDSWWVASNHEHKKLDILCGHEEPKEGCRIRVRESIAGVPGEAEGFLTEVVQNERATWEAVGVYHCWGVGIKIKEGVTWAVKSIEGGTELSAHVWAEFPSTLMGRVIEWVFRNLLNGIEKDKQHAMRELEYIKRHMQSEKKTTNDT